MIDTAAVWMFCLQTFLSGFNWNQIIFSGNDGDFVFVRSPRKIKLLLNQSRRHDFYYLAVIICPMHDFQTVQDENTSVNIESTII